MTTAMRGVRLGPADVTSLFTRLADEFVAQPAYLRIDGRPAILVLNLRDFVAEYGLDGVRFLLRLLRHRITERLQVDPFVVGLLADGTPANVATCQKLPCDGITGYGFLPDWAGPPVQSYAALVERRVAEWYRVQRDLSVPFFPVVCAGWDTSRRGVYVEDLRSVRGYPWRPVVTDTSPGLFGTFLDHALEFNAVTKDDRHQVVFVHAWNEWTEGVAVEPAEENGSAYLAEIAKRFVGRRAAVSLD